MSQITQSPRSTWQEWRAKKAQDANPARTRSNRGIPPLNDINLCWKCFGQQRIYEPLVSDEGQIVTYLPMMCEPCGGTGRVGQTPVDD